MNQHVAGKSYKHILWFGEYMMFEFVQGQMKFGIASYQTYSECVKIDDSHTPENAVDRIMAAIQGNSGSPFCVMMKTNTFLDTTVYRTMLAYTQHDKYSEYRDDVEFLQIYEQVMRLFVNCYIKKLFQESVEYVAQRFEDFHGFHKDLFPEENQPTRSSRQSVVSKCLAPTPTSSHGSVSKYEYVGQAKVDYGIVVPPIARLEWNRLKELCIGLVYHFEFVLARFTSLAVHKNQIPFFQQDMTFVQHTLSGIESVLQTKICGRLQAQFRNPLLFLTAYLDDINPNTSMTPDLIENIYQIVRIIETIESISH